MIDIAWPQDPRRPSRPGIRELPAFAVRRAQCHDRHHDQGSCGRGPARCRVIRFRDFLCSEQKAIFYSLYTRYSNHWGAIQMDTSLTSALRRPGCQGHGFACRHLRVCSGIRMYYILLMQIEYTRTAATRQDGTNRRCTAGEIHYYKAEISKAGI